MENISVVIGSWGSYNECNDRALGSKWLNLSDYSSWEEIEEELKKEGFELNGKDEELFIQDIEGIPDNCTNWDYVNPQQLFETLSEAGILEDEDLYDLFLAYLKVNNFSDWENLVSSRGSRWDDDIILYRNQDMDDVAYELMHEIYEIPDCLESYIDYSRFARDLSYDCYHETSKGVLEVR